MIPCEFLVVSLTILAISSCRTSEGRSFILRGGSSGTGSSSRVSETADAIRKCRKVNITSGNDKNRQPLGNQDVCNLNPNIGPWGQRSAKKLRKLYLGGGSSPSHAAVAPSHKQEKPTTHAFLEPSSNFLISILNQNQFHIFHLSQWNIIKHFVICKMKN